MNAGKARQAARRMINRSLMSDWMCPVGLDDLPDSAILCDYVDELEYMIKNNFSDQQGRLNLDYAENEEILVFAKEAAREVLLDSGFPV